MSPMKTLLLALSVTLSACGSTAVQETVPPTLVADAPAAEVYETWRAYAAKTDRRLFVHLGAPW